MRKLLELAQLDEYKLLGVSEGGCYTRRGTRRCGIRLQTRRGDQARLVAGGHDEHTNRQCILWVVSLKGLRMVTFSQSSTD
jgi:hypothetical protein